MTRSPVRSDEELQKLLGHFLTDDYYDLLIDSDTDVYSDDGEPLLIYRQNALSTRACLMAREGLKNAASTSSNRGIAGGIVDPERLPGNDSDRLGKVHGTRYMKLRADGTRSKTSHANPVRFGVIGYFDRTPRFPYCRKTAFNTDHPDKFRQAMPLITEVNDVFREELPQRWQAQRAMCEQTSASFVIGETAFTTITVNKTWQTAAHYDKGDLREGFGVMTAIRSGKFTGGHLVFPRWGIAVNMKTRGVCLANVHELHGNTPLVGKPGRYERLSLVLYYRERMHECGTPEQELQRAKNRKLGDPVHGK